jgi:asparagine synthase (glutamine-hydrolysing)
MKELLLPDVLSHKKQGFAVPLSEWFKGSLKEYAYDNLLSSDSMLSDYLNNNFVTNTLQNHQKGMRDFSNKLWSLLFFDEWMKQNQ